MVKKKLGRPKSKLTFIRKRLRKAQRTSKSKFIRKEAQIARALLNTPRAMRRIAGRQVFKKPLIEDPGQLKRTRVRPFIIVAQGAVISVVRT